MDRNKVEVYMYGFILPLITLGSVIAQVLVHACQTGSKCWKVIYICPVSIFMSKLQYIYPNCNICIQIVIYMSKMSVLANSSMLFDVSMSRKFFPASTTCKWLWIDLYRPQTKWRPSGVQNVLISFSSLWWESCKEQDVTCLPIKSTVQNSFVTEWTNMSEYEALVRYTAGIKP